jgi:hypothetical protein
MRTLILGMSLLAFTPAVMAPAYAQQPAAVAPAPTVTTPSQSSTVPAPAIEGETSFYRVAAIAAGAVGGVIVANALTAGMITPVLLTGSGGASAMMAGGGYALTAGQAGVTVVGAVVGGYVGNWLYGED